MENILNKFKIPFEPSASLNCEVPLCTFIGISAYTLMTHYFQCHRFDENFESSCVFSRKCFHEKKFKSYAALKSHTAKFHPSFVRKKTQLSDVDQVSTHNEEVQGYVEQQMSFESVEVNESESNRDDDNSGNFIYFKV